MGKLRSPWLHVVLIAAALVTHVVAAGPAALPETRDLHAAAAQSKARGLPLLVMFSAEHCGYCQRLEDEFLEPMVRGGEYRDRVIIHKVMTDGIAPIRDFRGDEVDAGHFADRYDIDVTPTVLLLDAEGRELTPRLVGLNNVDFYGAYLDRAIRRAYAKLNPTAP